jgi:deoxyribonuclease-4
MSIAGGVDRALERGAATGCEAIQIFLKNQVQWTGKPYAVDEVQRFRAQRTIPVFAHSSYLVNFAAADARRSLAAMVDEVRRADALGIPFIVMHPGAHMGAGEETGLRRVARNLDEVFRATPRSPVKIALETTAGQGTNLGYRFEHLATIIQSSNHPSRLAVCVDTCHVFAAGYDLRSAKGYRQMVSELDRLVGCDRVVAFHLNDSKTPLGSRVDRHEHIGKGHIGLDAFRRVVRDRRWRAVPMVLETPKGTEGRWDASNLRVLRQLAGCAKSSLPDG